eukprot:11198344-Lingulodinium_polyedra.AAC.1
MVRADCAPECGLPFERCEPACSQQPKRVAQCVAEGAKLLGSDLAGWGAHLADNGGPVGLRGHDCRREGRLPHM